MHTSVNNHLFKASRSLQTQLVLRLAHPKVNSVIKGSKRGAQHCSATQNMAKNDVEGLRVEQSIQAQAQDAVVWASQHGLVVGMPGDDKAVALVHAPLTVRPTPFPRASFEKAKRAATVFNTLIDRVSRDAKYLQDTLALAAEHDEFTACTHGWRNNAQAQLLEIHRNTAETREARQDSQVVLAINRSDYMLDEPSTTMLQVELNTIASSFGCLSTLVSRMHRYILERCPDPDQGMDSLPANDATKEISDALAAAVEAAGVPQGVVLMLVQPGEKNSYDQQWLQTALWEGHKVRTIRRTLSEVASSGQLDPQRGLSLGGIPVAVAYYRAGYSPDDYAGAEEWRARQMLEGSSAVQCPSVAYQLAGAKKVQQDLANPETLERFLDSPEEVELARSCFAGLWSLDNLEEASTSQVVEDAAAHPDKYVLKPQREGGGNNLYGQQLAEKLASRKGLSAFILMQRIRPPIQP